MNLPDLTAHVEEVESKAHRVAGRPDDGILMSLLVQGVWQVALQLGKLAEELRTRGC